MSCLSAALIIVGSVIISMETDELLAEVSLSAPDPVCSLREVTLGPSPCLYGETERH